jgi:parallel beta-helix repeat protein
VKHFSRWIHPSLLHLFCLAFCFTLSSFAQTNDYYVSPSGSDSNDGSQANPWATIDHASSALSLGASGTVVHVLPGNYSCVSTQRSGTATQRITYQSDTLHAAKISCSSAHPWENGNNSNTRVADYTDIVGFEITAGGTRCIGINQHGAFTHTLNNYVHDIPAPLANCGNGTGGAGIMIGYNGNPPTAAHDNLVSGNIVDAIGPGGNNNGYVHGIYVATYNNVIQNNRISRASGWGIHVHHLTTNEVITHNTVFNNYRGGIIVNGGPDNNYVCDHTTVSNNIVVNNGGNEYGIEESWGPTGPNNVYYNNIVYNNQPADFRFANGPRTVAGTITLTLTQFNGLFVNYTGDASGDYHLKAGSLGIAPGSSTCASGGITPCIPPTDLDGILRSASVFGLGAFAFKGSTLLPLAPTGLTATAQ